MERWIGRDGELSARGGAATVREWVSASCRHLHDDVGAHLVVFGRDLHDHL